MGKFKIVQFGNKTLRQKAKPVTVFHKKLHQLIDSMYETLKNVDDGAALAAPQVDVSKQITVIDYQGEYLELVNPEIIETRGERTEFEGCLSYVGYVGKVTRYEYVKVRYQNRFGEELVIERTGEMAKCLQHEIDHLNGILYIDRSKEKYIYHHDKNTKLNRQNVIDVSNGKPIKTSIFG